MTNIAKVILNRTLAAVAVVAMGFHVMANTTEWLVAPQYDSMEFYAPDVYKVMLDGKYGLIDSEGHVMVPPKYDVVFDFHDGTAVFGDYSSDGLMIKGTIGSDYSVSQVGKEYYMHDEYPFYSEGFIPVIDASGRYGYLDERCRPAFKFGSDETRPFSEGFAAVGEGDDFHWLTMTGERIFLSLPNGSYPYGGTNFHDGVAYLWDEYGEDFFIVDASFDVRKIKPRELTVDYMYRADSDKGLSIDYTRQQERYDRTLTPKLKNGKWSYTDSKGNLLASFQYDEADYFHGASAKARLNGKWGLLHVVEDDESFYVKSDKKVHMFKGKSGSECSFQLSMPEKWKGDVLSVIVKDPDSGVTFDLNKKEGNFYSFTYMPDESKKTESKTFQIDVKNDDIILWQGEESYDFAQAIDLVASLAVKNRKADSNNLCHVTATISNPSSIPVSAVVTLTGGGSNSQFKNQTVSLTIPANGNRTVSSSFILKGVELDGWCAVSTSEGGQARKSNLEFKPRD